MASARRAARVRRCGGAGCPRGVGGVGGASVADWRDARPLCARATAQRYRHSDVRERIADRRTTDPLEDGDAWWLYFMTHKPLAALGVD
ncbi:hypothetical protein [Paraburkholderia antibiotica]|uniref:Uncharacterized protein n=1 Tax=Paraburkholderia antibiotica TaxID=2728839 RepID=A0A7X9ZZS9_9BURK|nr:hypothetical protein [Paraburkholderia antibiotica]NML33910.1 hypothetical protein [Paraburkholderia antibiotica]